MAAHLAPRLVHPVAEADDVVELADVRRHDEHVRLAHNLGDLCANLTQRLRVDVRDDDAELLPVARRR